MSVIACFVALQNQLISENTAYLNSICDKTLFFFFHQHIPLTCTLNWICIFKKICLIGKQKNTEVCIPSQICTIKVLKSVNFSKDYSSLAEILNIEKSSFNYPITMCTFAKYFQLVTFLFLLNLKQNVNKTAPNDPTSSVPESRPFTAQQNLSPKTPAGILGLAFYYLLF